LDNSKLGFSDQFYHYLFPASHSHLHATQNPASMIKYANDPEVMGAMQNFMGMMKMFGNMPGMPAQPAQVRQ
jgi:hypothetical protein